MINKAYMDIKRYYGTREKLSISVVDESDNPVDINATYDNVLLQARERRRDEAPAKLLLNLSITGGGVTVNSNKILLDIDGEDIDPGSYPYDIFFKLSGADDYQVYLTGNLIIESNVTEV